MKRSPLFRGQPRRLTRDLLANCDLRHSGTGGGGGGGGTYDHTVTDGTHDWWADTKDNRFNNAQNRIQVGDYENDEIYHSGVYYETGIPQGATIDVAEFSGYVVQTAGASLVWRIHTQLDPNPSPHTSVPDMNVALTQLSGSFVQRSGLTGLDSLKTYDVSGPLQQAVDQVGFGGNVIIILTTVSSDDLLAGFHSSEGGSPSTNKLRLYVEYS